MKNNTSPKAKYERNKIKLILACIMFSISIAVIVTTTIYSVYSINASFELLIMLLPLIVGTLVSIRLLKLKRTVIALISIAVLITMGISVLAWYVFTGGFPTVTDSVEDYGEFKDFAGYSNLYIFPDDIPESAETVEYYYYYRDTFLDPTAQIYLECTYSAEGFQSEVERLASIQDTEEDTTHTVVYDTENFLSPAYVTIYNKNHCYEYALPFEEEHKIVYVYNQFITKNKIWFDESYLPKEYEAQQESANSFNLYYFNGHFQSEFQPNYQSNTLVLPDGETTFYVFTIKSQETGEETIDAVQMEYISKEDYRNTKSWEYTEMNGAIFKNLMLGDDDSYVMVTYEKDGEQLETKIDLETKKIID